MGEPVRIVDLARKMIALSGVPADIEFVGLRPGEKLHEALVHEHESLVPTAGQKILRVERVVDAPAILSAETRAIVHAGPPERRRLSGLLASELVSTLAQRLEAHR